jgi:pimeloyl-ACP methyl ester carboxylesterase
LTGDLEESQDHAMTESSVRANGIELAYAASGDPEGAPLLLVSGLGGQLVDWPPDLVAAFEREGFYVIRFDNRDSGLSEKLEGEADPQAAAAGDGAAPSYTLFDMADDAVALLDALGFDRAHVLGASMGGAILQCMLIRHPDRLASACVVMATTGDPEVGQAKPEALEALLASQPTGREATIEAFVAMSRIISGGGFPFDDDAMRAQATRSYDRMFYPAGQARHLAAMAATGDRTSALRSVTVPTVVVHGELDPLVGVSGGEAVARAIPESQLVVIPGMGHEFPQGAWPHIVEALVINASRAR